MTQHELEQIYWLKIEIIKYEQELYEIENQGTNIDLNKVGDKSSGLSDKTANLALKIAEYKDLIKDKYIELVEMKIAAEKYISSIDDVQLRLAMRLRYIEMWNWYKIARAIGSHSEATPRMMINRFFNEK